MKNNFVGLHSDFIGFGLSMACLIHCIGLPFLLSLAPLTGLSFLQNPWIEYTIIIFSLLIASYALVHGYRKHHKKPSALYVVSAGFIIIFLGHLTQVEWTELLLTTIGATLVASAHFINWKHIKNSTVQFPDCSTENYKNN